jgi:hypothetical protein
MPCIQLYGDDNDVSPKPVEIMGCNFDQNIYLRMYSSNGYAGEYRMGSDSRLRLRGAVKE